VYRIKKVKKAAKVQQRAVEPWMDGWMDGWCVTEQQVILYYRCVSFANRSLFVKQNQEHNIKMFPDIFKGKIKIPTLFSFRA
jgi:hypothetical protein